MNCNTHHRLKQGIERAFTFGCVITDIGSGQFPIKCVYKTNYCVLKKKKSLSCGGF